MQSEITKKRLPYLDLAAFIIRKAAETHQISFKADSRNVRHAEKFYTAGIIRVQLFFFVFAINRGPIIGIHEPIPLIVHWKKNQNTPISSVSCKSLWWGHAERIYESFIGCEVQIENSIKRVTVWHAQTVIPSEGSFNLHRTTILFLACISFDNCI